MAATLTIRPDGTIEDASPDALLLLAVGLEQLRSLPPGAFSPEPPDHEASAAFRREWESVGQPDIGGEASLQRPDGSKVRVRFAISALDDGRYFAVLARTRGATSAPPRIFTGGTILAEWRAAEKRLAHLQPGSPEAAPIETEIAKLRAAYQDLFASR